VIKIRSKFSSIVAMVKDRSFGASQWKYKVIIRTRYYFLGITWNFTLTVLTFQSLLSLS